MLVISFHLESVSKRAKSILFVIILLFVIKYYFAELSLTSIENHSDLKGRKWFTVDWGKVRTTFVLGSTKYSQGNASYLTKS